MSKFFFSVCITVHNRPKTAAKTITNWKKYMPENSQLIIVDDASEPPFPGATYRFETNAGIPRAKNMCLQLAENSSHIALVDDDVYPKTKDWYKPYVESGENHLMFTFDHLKGGQANGYKKMVTSGPIVSYNAPCGCMLYIRRNVLDVVGGFDIKFNKYFYEHVNFSQRVFNAGLTTYPFGDVENSLDLFHSMDWAGEVESSVQEDRMWLLRQNKRYFESQKDSKEFKPYK